MVGFFFKSQIWNLFRFELWLHPSGKAPVETAWSTGLLVNHLYELLCMSHKNGRVPQIADGAYVINRGCTTTHFHYFTATVKKDSLCKRWNSVRVISSSNWWTLLLYHLPRSLWIIQQITLAKQSGFHTHLSNRAYHPHKPCLDVLDEKWNAVLNGVAALSHLSSYLMFVILIYTVNTAATYLIHICMLYDSCAFFSLQMQMVWIIAVPPRDMNIIRNALLHHFWCKIKQAALKQQQLVLGNKSWYVSWLAGILMATCLHQLACMI